MKGIKLLIVISCINFSSSMAQQCDCNKEFLFIKKFIEANYAGYADKLKSMTKAGYNKMANELLLQSKQKYAAQKCLALIGKYLQSFKDDHIQVGANFDGAKLDSQFISQGETITISAAKMAQLKNSKGIEGIYNFQFDSTYKIAVIKNKNSYRDYVGVLLSSKLPHWTNGQIKFEAIQLHDSLLKGVLYMRNHMPRAEWFLLEKTPLAAIG